MGPARRVGGGRAAPVWLLAAAVLALAGCGAGDSGPTHVVLISIDSLRADHLGCYGYERPTSPEIDRLAAEGVLVERAVSSSSWTLPAHAALFTGQADSLHGVVDSDLALGPGIATLAERLGEAGFATAAVVSGPLLLPGYGLDRGFDEYLNCMGFLDEEFRSQGGEGRTMKQLHQASHSDVTSPCVVRRAAEWLDRHRQGPGFLFLHFWDVHYDYQPPAELVARFDPDYTGTLDARGFSGNAAISPAMAPRDLEHLIALYDAEIAYTDAHVGEVLRRLAELGLADRALVILTSDHGDAFFEHGRKGHKKDLHAESVRIPLVFRGPGLPRGERRAGPAQISDVAPTVLELLGLPPLEGDPGPGRGRSLAGLLTAAAPAEERWVVSEMEAGGRDHLAVEGPRWKLMLNRKTGKVRAYDLASDPGETRPVKPPPEARRRVLDAARALALGRPHRAAVPLGGLPPEARERLRALGYLD